MSSATIQFETTLLQTGKTTTGILVPPEVIQQLAAGARPAVVANVSGYAYRTTVGVMRGQSLLPFSAEHRAASGLAGGDAITVDLSLDTQPRTVAIPDDLAQALDAPPSTRAAFQRQAPSRQKANVDNVLDAKTPETRARRVAAIVARLVG